MLKFTREEQAIIDQANEILGRKLLNTNVFTNCESVKLYLRTQVATKTVEHFGVLWLSTQHQLLASEVLFRGTINACSVYPRTVLESAIQHGAGACIFYHNHPSGMTAPSQADIQITKRLQDVLSNIDCNVLDHFILSSGNGDNTVSFSDRGLL